MTHRLGVRTHSRAGSSPSRFHRDTPPPGGGLFIKNMLPLFLISLLLIGNSLFWTPPLWRGFRDTKNGLECKFASKTVFL